MDVRAELGARGCVVEPLDLQGDRRGAARLGGDDLRRGVIGRLGGRRLEVAELTGATGAGSAAGISGFTDSAGAASSGFNAADFSGSAGAASAAGAAGVSVSAGEIAAALSGAFSATGGSKRSRASVGTTGSLGWANTGSGVGRRDGMLANCSWAARSNEAAPSPKTITDIDRTIAANRKRKPGSMDASSALPRTAGLLMSKGTRWPLEGTRILTSNQADSRISQRLEPVCYKIRGRSRRLADEGRFLSREASLPQLSRPSQKDRSGPNVADLS